MNISFLNPWFWVGALAVAAPIWLHLRRREPPNLRRFSALRFLDDEPVPQRSPLRLRDLVLLAIRVLALLLLISALAWPYRRDALTPPVRESLVYILDNTLSHQVADGFGRSRDRILEDLARAGIDRQIAVIELTSQPRVITGFGDDPEFARGRVRALKPSHQRGPYLAAFRLAESLLSQSLGARKRIVMLSDSQENQWIESAHTPPFLTDVETELAAPDPAPAVNVSLAVPELQRIFLGEKSVILFTVGVARQGGVPFAEIVLKTEDKTILEQRLDFAGQPDRFTLQAQWESDPAAWVRGEVLLKAEGDVLAADDHAFFSMPPVVEGKVVLLAQSPFLKLALSPEIMRGRWSATVLDPSRIPADASSDGDILCLEANYLQSGAARQLLNRYLSNGRGVLLLVNHYTPTVRGALRELGFELEAEPRIFSQSQPFRYVFTGHPLFHPFASSDLGNLLEVQVHSHARLKSAEAMPLIFSAAGEPLFFQSRQHPGKLFVSAFGFDRAQTSWPVHPSFIPFLDLCLQNARPAPAETLGFEPGAMDLVQAPAGTIEVLLVSTTGDSIRVPVRDGAARLPIPDQPGLYQVKFDGQSTPAKIIHVNPPPKESELQSISGAELVKAWTRTRSEAIDAGTATLPPLPARALHEILQQQIWWWLLGIGFILLLTETAWIT